MPLEGDYEPSPSSWSRKQAELYEATNGEQGADLQGRPVILLTSVGARTGKVRKTPLMRVERDGVYAVVGHDDTLLAVGLALVALAGTIACGGAALLLSTKIGNWFILIGSVSALIGLAGIAMSIGARLLWVSTSVTCCIAAPF